MIICLQTRQGKIHYITWDSLSRGYYYTACDKVFSKKNHLNIFGIDESIPGACINCRKVGEKECDSRTYRSVLGEGTFLKYLDIQSGWKAPKEIFENLLDRRLWTKLRKMKNKIRQSTHKKSKKHNRLFYE